MTGPPFDPAEREQRGPAAASREPSGAGEAPGGPPGGPKAPGEATGAPETPGAPTGPRETTGELSYEDAAARIEAIIRRLDSGEAGLRETLDLVREGRELVELCAAELEAVGRGLQELELDELIARLESAPAPRGGEPGGSSSPA